MPTDARDVALEPVTGLGANVPPAFVEALFGRVAAEDLARLSAADLGRLADAAWRHLQHRRPGTPDVAIAAVELPDLAEPVTVVEIVNDDMPFLLDSVMAEIVERGAEVRLLAHPILAVDRDAAGTLVAFRGEANRADAEDMARESLIHIHLDPVADPEGLAVALGLVLRDVRASTSAWRAMTASVRARIKALRSEPPGLAPAELEEAAGFLEWLLDGNFTFLGIEHELLLPGGGLERDPASRLGILAEEDPGIPSRGGKSLFGRSEMERFLDAPVPLAVLKAGARSRVHRRTHMDLIVVKLFAADGSVRGEALILGLFASGVYTNSPRTIPYLRRKVARVAARVGFDPDSHSGKALLNVLETYPRDELFQIDVDLLQSFALEIMTLYERPRIRVLPRPDRFGRFVSVLVYVLRERYDTAARHRIGTYLASVFDGRVSAVSPSFPEGPLARVHFIIGRDGGEAPSVPRPALEAEIARLVQTWPDALNAALAAAYPGAPGRALALRYANAFGAGYREAFDAAAALVDIETIERFGGQNRLAIDFYRHEEPDAAGLKVLSLGRPLPLSERVPMLEAMGFTVVAERTFEIEPEGLEGGPVFLHDMTLARARGGPIDMDALAGRFEALLVEVLMGRLESDGYNALVLEGGLAWPDVVLVRTLSRYLRQARVPFSQDYMWATLVRHAGVAEKIVALFRARFDPDRFGSGEERAAAEAVILAAIEEDLKAVESLDEDRILRRFVNLVQAAVRTNFFQTGPDGAPKRTVAIKLESRKVEDLPSPRPLYEIFLHSARVEGVHLRFGRIARGGIRWSDRPQDFRTEVLGLVKAQQVKNAVIVPVGAKGGFVPKKLPAGPREAVQAEGTEAYKLFISTMLDITDDLDGKTLVPPERVVRHDGDDPYLVVAADKGTATFSDTANAISAEHHYWLGDAFASGGSVGYDHKDMGITARGAWVAVQRHFREMDTDIQTTPFTAVGVGDMSGDVFGNGMLLSPVTRLVAAFDHRDIFLDPSPDPATGIAERQRLFALPRSSWKDYDKALISPGGGVFARSLKSIPLTPEVRAALGFDKPAATPAELMRAILRAPVDLVFFGGIGTYVRASSETDEEVGDRANDPLRITGAEIRAKVVGEGANLGMTQRGRIEAARHGVRLNTDAIDNSAGVNTSDVEVNIKIALATPVRDGSLDEAARNALLAAMTDEVAGLVLRNNYEQTLAITLAERRGAEDLGFARRLMQTLESRGLLDRAVEALPDDATLAERARAGEGLTRPEIAVLLAYSKLALNADLLASGVPDDPYLSRDLDDYFPSAMRERFLGAIETHRLRREIIATQLGNAMINRGGPTLIVRIADQTGADVPAIAAAFAAARQSFALYDLKHGIDALDNRVAGTVQSELYATLQELLLSRMVWFLRNVDLSAGLDAVVARFRPGIEAVRTWLAASQAESAHRKQRADTLLAQGVPEAMAHTVADLHALAFAPDAVLVAEEAGIGIDAAAALLFAAGEYFQLERIVTAARAMPVGDHFERLAIDRAIDQLAASQRAIAIDAAKAGSVEDWAKLRPESARFRGAAGEIAAAGGLTLARLTVVTSLLGDLARRR